MQEVVLLEPLVALTMVRTTSALKEQLGFDVALNNCFLGNTAVQCGTS